MRVYKLNNSIATIILLEILQEDRKRENRRGKTKGWIRIREEKGNCNNIPLELMIETTPRLPRFLAPLSLERVIWGSDDTLSEKFKFVGLGLPLIPIPENRAQKPEGLLKRLPFILAWTGNVLKMEHFDDVTTITWFPCPCCLQTQIQNNQWLLRF